MNHQKEYRLSIWDVFDEYADVRDDLEDTIAVCQSMKDDLESSMEEISDQLNDIEERLHQCDLIFRRFKRQQRNPMQMETVSIPDEFPDSEFPW